MDFLVSLIPLVPLVATLTIGLGQFSRFLDGSRSEALTSRIACWSVYISTALCFALLWLDSNNALTGSYTVGTWLNSGTFIVSLSFQTAGPGLILSCLFSLLFIVIFRFSRNYLHSEKGFHRFFMLLSLLVFAMYMILLSGNVIMTFIGWELAGASSFLLIAFAWHRENASKNACMVFIVNRIGDAFFILAAILCHTWLNTLEWQEVNNQIGTLSATQVNLIAFSFAMAAMVKSVQFPFTWWLNRSMEGPTPSSAVFYGAVMVHSGVFLLILLSPVFDHSSAISLLLIAVGLLTFAYSLLSVQTQVDIKSSLGFSTAGQLGLMFVECGFGQWQLAFIHLCAHAIVRCYLYLTAPSILHNVHGNPVIPVTLKHPLLRWLSLASLHNFWLEETSHQLISKPCRQLSSDLAKLDDNFVDPLIGLPTAAVLSGARLAQREEQIIGARLDTDENNFSSGSGLAGHLTAWVAACSGWFEHHFVLQGIEQKLPAAGRRMGFVANSIEQLLLRTRYLIIFIVIVLLFAL